MSLQRFISVYVCVRYVIYVQASTGMYVGTLRWQKTLATESGELEFVDD